MEKNLSPQTSICGYILKLRFGMPWCWQHQGGFFAILVASIAVGGNIVGNTVGSYIYKRLARVSAIY